LNNAVNHKKKSPAPQKKGKGKVAKRNDKGLAVEEKRHHPPPINGRRKIPGKKKRNETKNHET